ncbi:Protein of unknown function [Gryllus bimaculatus]|nr:Protein of unknown function [Gryllus bimaculatus]
MKAEPAGRPSSAAAVAHYYWSSPSPPPPTPRDPMRLAPAGPAGRPTEAACRSTAAVEQPSLRWPRSRTLHARLVAGGAAAGVHSARPPGGVGVLAQAVQVSPSRTTLCTYNNVRLGK